MVKGVMVALLCPMMDEQLFHSLQSEKDPYRLVVLENDVSAKTEKRLTERGIRFETFPERGFCNGLLDVDREEFTIVLRINSLGLHADPKKLRDYVEGEIEEMQPYADVFAMYYGTCGNAMWTPDEWACKRGFKPLYILRNDVDGNVVDDCVGVWIGNGHTYHDFIRKYTGVFLVTPSTADNWEEFIGAGDGKEFKSLSDDIKEELGVTDISSYMRWLFEIGGYKNILKIKTGYEHDPELFEKEYREIAKAVNLKPILVEDGWVTISPADKIYHSAKAVLSG